MLPVYISEILIPPLPGSLKEMDYDTSERKLFYSSVTKSMPYFQQSANIVLSKGKFNLHTIAIEEKEAKELFREVRFKTDPLVIDKNRTWPLNFIYKLDNQTIQKILSKHNADAIYFHFFQANKRLYTHSWYGYKVTYYVTLPLWYLEYSGVIYDSSGKTIFSKTVKYLKMETMIDRGNGKYGSIKIPVRNMDLYYLEEQNVKTEMYQKRGSFFRDFIKI